MRSSLAGSRRSAFVLVLVAALGLLGAACSPNRLADGRITTLTEELAAMRSGLAISVPSAPVTLAYSVVPRCEYESTITPVDQPRGTNSRIIVSMRPVRDRLQVVMVRPDQPTSSYLMDRTGRLIDFNAVQNDGTVARVTSENRREVHAAKMREVAGRPGANVINEFSVFYPEFASRGVLPGNVAATLASLVGEPWGEFFLVGLTQYEGRLVAVLDFVRTIRDERRVYGFNLVDVRTGLPVFVAVNAGTRLLYRQISCGP